MANISHLGEKIQLQGGQWYVLADARTLDGTTFPAGSKPFGPDRILKAEEILDDPRYAFHTESGWLVVARKDIWDDIRPLLHYDTLLDDWEAIEDRFEPGACGLVAFEGRGYHRLNIQTATVTLARISANYPIGSFFDEVPDAASLLRSIIDVVGLEATSWEDLKDALRTKAAALGGDSMALVLHGVDELRRKQPEIFANLEAIAKELCDELGRNKVKVIYPTKI